MTSVEYVDQLVRCQDPDGALLSVYVTVPAEVAALREMFVRLDGLLGAVSPPAAASAAIRRAVAGEVERVRDTVVEHARDWLDHGVAIVSSAALGLHEAVPVRAPVPDRAVVGVRPHVRPLLAALRQARPYVVAVVDRRHAWLYRVDGDDLAATGQLVGKGVRDRSHGGWAGLQEYGVRHRAAELARRHYRSTAAELASLLGACDDDLIVGGHDVSIAEFLEMLPKSMRIRVTGTFSDRPAHDDDRGAARPRCGCSGSSPDRARTPARCRPRRPGGRRDGRERSGALCGSRQPVPDRPVGGRRLRPRAGVRVRQLRRSRG